MKKFNKVIQIEVSVDAIANNLLNAMNPEFKHKELVTEAIIGRMSNEDEPGLTSLYNSLNGFTNDIDFEVGDTIEAIEGHSLRVFGKWNEGIDEGTKSSRKSVTRVKVIEIDLYKHRKLHVSCRDDEGNVHIDWVNHMHWNKIKEEDIAGVSENTEAIS